MIRKLAIHLLLRIIATEKITIIEDLPDSKFSYWKSAALKASDAWVRERRKNEVMQIRIKDLLKISEKQIMNPALASYKIRETK